MPACYPKEGSRVGPHVRVLRSAACTLGSVAHPRFVSKALAALRYPTPSALAACLYIIDHLYNVSSGRRRRGASSRPFAGPFAAWMPG
jgi:hypothetical protein